MTARSASHHHPVASKAGQTRTRVIRAAIACIDAHGFHAASTNRIAASAGVSWGVLQYHFADKAGLLRAVVEHIYAGFSTALGQAAQPHGPLEERVRAVIDIAWSQISLPDYRVSMTILREAGQIGQRGLVTRWRAEIGALWQQAFADVAAGAETSDAAMRLMFAALRGLADEVNPAPAPADPHLQRELAALAEALVFLLGR